MDAEGWPEIMRFRGVIYHENGLISRQYSTPAVKIGEGLNTASSPPSPIGQIPGAHPSPTRNTSSILVIKSDDRVLLRDVLSLANLLTVYRRGHAIRSRVQANEITFDRINQCALAAHV